MFRAITPPAWPKLYGAQAGLEGGAVAELDDLRAADPEARRTDCRRRPAAADATGKTAQQAAQDRLEHGVAGRLQGDLGEVEGQALEHVA
ncbi:MAG: hypothetical protein V3U93_05900 [Alphaproteobacteria bacterium]